MGIREIDIPELEDVEDVQGRVGQWEGGPFIKSLLADNQFKPIEPTKVTEPPWTIANDGSVVLKF